MFRLCVPSDLQTLRVRSRAGGVTALKPTPDVTPGPLLFCVGFVGAVQGAGCG
jgi:hypothetical protein